MSESNHADYAAIDAVNWSSLKHMRESPLVYRHRLTCGYDDTPALAMGRVTHTLVFEPEKFAAEYAIWEDGDRRGKAYAEFVEANAGKTIFKPKEIDTAVAMADAVRSHPLVQPYLDDGLFEHSIRWTDPETGLPCKARPDWIIPSTRTLIDLKTCQSAEGRRFGSAAARYCYHMQMSMYVNAITYGLGWAPNEVKIIAVEKDAPHEVAIFHVPEDDLYLAAEEVAALLRMVKVCRQTNTWPGRYLEEQALRLPAWVSMEDDEDPESLGLTIGGK